MAKQSNNEVRRLPLGTKAFEANGKKYHVSNTLSVERWRYFEDFQAMVGLGRSFQDVFDNVKKAYEALQHPKIADASVILHNILVGVGEKLEERHDPALMLCALFINEEGEDERVYDLEKMNDKIKNWQKEGYAMADFFSLAFNLVPDFINSYNAVLEDISAPKKKKK